MGCAELGLPFPKRMTHHLRCLMWTTSRNLWMNADRGFCMLDEMMTESEKVSIHAPMSDVVMDAVWIDVPDSIKRCAIKRMHNNEG